jgi:acetoin utilization deacetylase AcuC-like enzyme
MWHNTWNWALVRPPSLTVQPGEHAENPETKRRFRNLIEVSGLLDHLFQIRPRYATEDELARLHTRDHIARIKSLSAENGGGTDTLTPFGHGSFEIARLAAGGVMAACDAVIEGQVSNAYALVRPPGHHATADASMGFCLFGNAALAIMHAQTVHKVGRVATVDWDVHHGNGTQSAFYERNDVLTISLHQDGLFPAQSGGLEEVGTGKGVGFNLNVPLPPGSGNGAYLAAFEQVVIPALIRFKPELIVVPSGFDASGFDPLGRMMVSSEGYRTMTRMLKMAAHDLCSGRLVMSHEGGYSQAYVPYCGFAVLEELSGIKTQVEDPWATRMASWPGQTLQPHQQAAISAAARLVESIA